MRGTFASSAATRCLYVFFISPIYDSLIQSMQQTTCAASMVTMNLVLYWVVKLLAQILLWMLKVCDGSCYVVVHVPTRVCKACDAEDNTADIIHTSYVDPQAVNNEGPYAVTSGTPFANNHLLSRRSCTATLLCAFSLLLSSATLLCAFYLSLPPSATLLCAFFLSLPPSDAHVIVCFCTQLIIL